MILSNEKVIDRDDRDILDKTDVLIIEGYLFAVDNEKAFHSRDCYFLPAIIEQYGFKNKFLRQIEALLSNQESCIINGEITTHYFKLNKKTNKGGLILAYLFFSSIQSCTLCN